MATDHTHLPAESQEVGVEVHIGHDVREVLRVGTILVIQREEDLLSAQHEGQLLPQETRGRNFSQ